MDNKPEAAQALKVEKVEKIEKVDLAAAVRRARVENAERAAAIADLREIEAGRLALLESALKPVVRQAPPGVDMFDLTLSQGEHPRLFLDMVAFVDMGRDRRTYRFFQDTLHGRVLIAECQQIDRIAAAVTNYVARRLVERERALAAESAAEQARDPAARPVVWQTKAARGKSERAAPSSAAPVREGPQSVLPSPAAASLAEARAPAATIAPPQPEQRRGFVTRIGEALRFVIMTLGSITLIGLVAVAGYVAWTIRLHDVWTRWTGASPF